MNDTGLDSMHRLVQLFLHEWLEKSGVKTFYSEAALKLLADRQDNKELCDSLFPHAQVALQYNIRTGPAGGPVIQYGLVQMADEKIQPCLWSLRGSWYKSKTAR
jgi:hypothetical protein